MQLTNQDVNTLIEALDAWEQSGFAGQLMGDMFAGMLCKDESAMEKMKAERERSNAEYERKVRAKKERSIILKAKLLQLRDSIEVDSLLEHSNH